MTPTIADSLDFAKENHISVIPVKFKNKIPLVSWKEYQSRCASDDEIHAWFNIGDELNIGFVTGSVSGKDGYCFVVIDIDDFELFKELYPNGVNTRAVRTSKGAHLYFFLPKSINKFRIEIEKENGDVVGVDVQGEGAYVIAPGSIHPDGTIYDWINDAPIACLNGETPVHFKQRLIRRIDETCKENGCKRKGSDEYNIEQIIHGVQSGKRNESAYKLASYYKQCGRAQAKTEDLLEEWNERCEPPLPHTELMSVVASAFKINAKTGFDFGLDDKSWESKFFTEKGKPKVKAISEEIKSRQAFICLKDTEELYWYNPRRGIYEAGGETIIKSECKSNYSSVINQYWNREILAYIQATTYVDRKDLNSQPNLLHLQNGIFDIDTYEFRPFSLDVMSTIALPIHYDPKARCPVFEKFLNEVAQPLDIQLIKEIIGYCLYRNYDIHRFFLLIGKGSNGKTTLLELIIVFLGSENITSVSLQSLVNRPFNLSYLYGKLACINADLTAKALAQTGELKQTTGGDTLFADVKYKKAIEFINHAKLIYACNEAPAISEDTLALWRRFILIKFENTFIDGVNKDPLMLKKLTTPQELSGLFNVAVKALKTLLNRGYFDYEPDMERVKEDYTRLSNSFRAFVEECVDQEYDAMVTKHEFYRLYREWCIKHGLKLQSMNLVGRRVKEYTNATEGKIAEDHGRKECWKGIRVKSVDEENSCEKADERRIEEY